MFLQRLRNYPFQAMDTDASLRIASKPTLNHGKLQGFRRTLPSHLAFTFGESTVSAPSDKTAQKVRSSRSLSERKPQQLGN